MLFLFSAFSRSSTVMLTKIVDVKYQAFDESSSSRSKADETRMLIMMMMMSVNDNYSFAGYCDVNWRRGFGFPITGTRFNCRSYLSFRDDDSSYCQELSHDLCRFLGKFRLEVSIYWSGFGSVPQAFYVHSTV